MQQKNFFDLTARVAIVTGNGGFLGVQHAKAVHFGGEIPVLADLNFPRALDAVTQVGGRAIAISNNQPEEFVRRISNLIPMGRMSRQDERQDAVIFLRSDAVRFMSGAVVMVDGGRTAW